MGIKIEADLTEMEKLDREKLKQAFVDMKKEISINEIIDFEYETKDCRDGKIVSMKLLIKPEYKK